MPLFGTLVFLFGGVLLSAFLTHRGAAGSRGEEERQARDLYADPLSAGRMLRAFGGLAVLLGAVVLAGPRLNSGASGSRIGQSAALKVAARIALDSSNHLAEVQWRSRRMLFSVGPAGVVLHHAADEDAGSAGRGEPGEGA